MHVRDLGMFQSQSCLIQYIPNASSGINMSARSISCQPTPCGIWSLVSNTDDLADPAIPAIERMRQGYVQEH
jgi:hypothetical protein